MLLVWTPCNIQAFLNVKGCRLVGTAGLRPLVRGRSTKRIGSLDNICLTLGVMGGGALTKNETKRCLINEGQARQASQLSVSFGHADARSVTAIFRAVKLQKFPRA